MILSGDSRIESGDSKASSGDSVTESGDSIAKSGDSRTESGDSVVKSGDSGIESGDSVPDLSRSTRISVTFCAISGVSAHRRVKSPAAFLCPTLKTQVGTRLTMASQGFFHGIMQMTEV